MKELQLDPSTGTSTSTLSRYETLDHRPLSLTYANGIR